MDTNDLQTIASLLGQTGIGAVTLNFVNKILGPTGEEVGKYLLFRLKQLPLGKQLQVLTEASKMVEEAGAQPNQVDPKFIVPFMEAASLESDEGLSKKWAALLANATVYGDGASQVTFIDILRQLTPPQAALLEELHRLAPGELAPRGQLALFGSIAINPYNLSEFFSLLKISYLDREKFNSCLFSLDNLMRLRLIIGSEKLNHPDTRRYDLSTTKDDTIAITYLGHAFLAACSPPVEAPRIA